MSDEEYGRAWAEMMGKRPFFDPVTDYWRWMPAAASTAPVAVSEIIYSSMYTHGNDTENGAYAVLGCAVRRVQAIVPRLPNE